MFTIEDVLLSNQTMALCRGLPVFLLNATVVSLWLVIPIAFTFAEVNECLIDRLSRHSIT